MCVDKPAKYQIALANRLAEQRWDNKAKAVLGPNTCKSVSGKPFVWRFADPFDYVCVDPSTRDAAANDNVER